MIAAVLASEPSVASFGSGSAPSAPALAPRESLIYPTILDKFERDMAISLQLSMASFAKLEPRVNQGAPAPAPYVNADRSRLELRLEMYNLTEKQVKGDGACQFRSLSDQLYGTEDHPREVRQAVMEQLVAGRDKYSCYVPIDYDAYLADMEKPFTWGDHITLKAAADKFGCRVMVLTSYKENCVIKIDPETSTSDRVLWLSFWAEVHYNSLQSREDVEHAAVVAEEAKRQHEIAEAAASAAAAAAAATAVASCGPPPVSVMGKLGKAFGL